MRNTTKLKLTYDEIRVLMLYAGLALGSAAALAFAIRRRRKNASDDNE